MSTSYFVGRSIEAEELYKELKKHHTSHNIKSIVNLYGIGGVGKTTLLDKVLDRLKENDEFIYFKVNEDLNYDNVPVFVSELSQSIAGNNIKFDNDFESLKDIERKYREGIGELEAQLNDAERKKLNAILKKMHKLVKHKGKRKYPLPKIKIGKLKWGEKEFAGFETDFGDIQGSEKDNKSVYEALKEEYEITEKHFIESKGKDKYTQDLIKEPIPEITKAFITGLKESVYPRLIWRKNFTKKPVKVIMVIDTYEKVSDDVNDWLLYFIPKIMALKEDYDFRLVISGRERLLLTDELRRWDNFKQLLLEKDIQRFTEKELKDYLRLRGIDEKQYENILFDTDGLPYLVEMWCESVNKSEGLNYLLMENRVFWWKTDIEKDWIRASAFLEYINIDTLRVFFQNQAIDAFEFLKECHEVCRYISDTTDNLILHPIIKKVLLKSTEQRSPELFQTFRHKIKLYQDISNLFPDILTKNKMMNLSLFKCFNQKSYSIISEIDSFSINEFVNDNDNYFDKNKHSFSLKSEYKIKLLEYYHSINPEDVKLKIDLIKSKWEIQKQEIEDKLNNCNSDLKENELKISNLNSLKEDKAKELLGLGKTDKIVKPTVKLQYDNQENKKSNLNFSKTGFALLFVGILGIIVNSVILNFNVLIYIISLIVLTISIYIIYKSKTGKQVTNEINPISEILSNDFSNDEKRILLLKKSIIELENEIKVLTDKRNEISMTINQYKELLNENYI